MIKAINVSETYTAVGGNVIAADTSGAAFTITLLDTTSLGDVVQFVDAKLTWNTNNLTVSPGDGKINGGTSNYVANTVGLKFTATYLGTSYGWSVK